MLERMSDEDFEAWCEDLASTNRDAFVAEARRAREGEAGAQIDRENALRLLERARDEIVMFLKQAGREDGCP